MSGRNKGEMVETVRLWRIPPAGNILRMWNHWPRDEQPGSCAK